MSTTLSVSEKHRLYEASVQCHEGDIDFLNKEYRRIYNRAPLSLREDFGGTGLLACEWVRQSPEHTAYAIDLDPEPISYGYENHYFRLNEEEKKRMKYIEGNVLADFDFKADIVVAFNFSYFIFKKRHELLDYFKRVRAGMKNDGAFFIDLFGGTEARSPLVEETEHEDEGFSYFWDCDSYNPITNEVQYYIHFKTLNDGKMHREVFSYDWRMWTMMELREVLEDAGFSKTVTYWEGEDEDGEGDGNFYPSEKEENCESWVTYIMALP